MSGTSIILMQTFYYAVVMALTLLLVGAFLRGFLLTYIRVRLSFGKFLIVKIRTQVRDYFEKGWIEDGFLVFKVRGEERRLAINPKDRVLYRCINVNWVDVDEEFNSVAKFNYDHVEGFNADKYDNLLKRALTRPTIDDKRDKIIFALIFVIMIGVALSLYFTYSNYGQVQALMKQLPGMFANLRGTIVGGNTII